MEPGAVFGLLILATGAALVLYAGLTAPASVDTDDAEAYLRSLDMTPEEADEFQQLLAEPFVNRVLRPVGARVSGFVGGALPGNYRDRLHLQLLHAGLQHRFRAEEIIAGQVLGGVGGLLLAILAGATRSLDSNLALLVLVFLPVCGALLPKVWLDRQLADRRDAILRDLPDTLDLLAISVEAGVGFEGALGIVCENFDSPLADEFSRTLREMELGLPRREALQNLKRRTEVPELSNFVLALTQADALGMPIGRVLKTQAEEMRTKRQQWARERAAKLPVKILFPLVAFIFPSIFVIVLGPAAAEIGKAFN
jgi:tight adherence protein C